MDEVPVKRGRGRPKGSKNRLRFAENKVVEKFLPTNVTRKLTPSEQVEVARRIAWFWSNNEILKFVNKEMGKSLDQASIGAMRKSEIWIPVIEQFRGVYIEKLSEVPLFHKKKRLEELQDQYEFFKEKGNKKVARSILRDIRDECEGKGSESFSLTVINHNEFNQMTDEDIQREKIKTLEDLEKVKRMKLLGGPIASGNGTQIEITGS